MNPALRSTIGRHRRLNIVARCFCVTLHVMLRRLRTVLSALSLLLCVGTAVLWVRSYWWHDIVSYTFVTRETVNETGAFPPSFQDVKKFSFQILPGTLSF